MAHIQWKKDVAYIVDKRRKRAWIKLGKIPVKAADRALAKYKSDATYLRLGFLGDSRISFDDLASEYFKDAVKTKGAYTVQVEESQMAKLVRDWRGRVASEITSLEAEDKLHSYGYKPTTIRNKMVILSNVWAYGVLKGYFAANEMKKCRRPELEALPPVIIAEEAIDALIEHCPVRSKNFLMVMKYTSSRPSAVRKIQVKDVDIKARKILWRHTKNKRSAYGPIAEKLVPVLEELTKYRGPEDYIFEGCTKNTLRVDFDKAKARAGVLKAFPYAFRHFSINKFLDITGGDLRAAQQFARHAMIQTTIRYTHRPPEVLKSGADKL